MIANIGKGPEMETTKWDVADFLDSPEAIAAYLNAAMEDGDPVLINAALGDVARARGMTRMARDTGLAREALYRALRPEGRPEFTTVVKVIKALGLRLSTNAPSAESKKVRRKPTGASPANRNAGGKGVLHSKAPQARALRKARLNKA